MIFPLTTDVRLRRTPWVNVTLIAINAVIFIVMINAPPELVRRWTEALLLHPMDPRLYQFVSYQFLHAGWGHILFNMLFLWTFGNNLEDRLGRIGYLFFYLGGGIVAGLGHALTSESPVLGASGSVSAVTGAFLALFSQSRVTIVYWFFIVGALTIPSIWLIMFSVGMDILQAATGLGGNVAHLAHLSGNLYGFVLGMALLATRVLPREPYDFVAMLGRWRRKRQMQQLARSGTSPWHKDAARQLQQEPDRPDPRHEAIVNERAEIARQLGREQPELALDAYERLLQHDSHHTMPRQQQLDLANYAMTHGRHETAARAYEAFARRFASDEYVPEVQLILGLIYARYLDLPDRARPMLEQARKRLHAPDRRAMADKILDELPKV